MHSCLDKMARVAFKDMSAGAFLYHIEPHVKVGCVGGQSCMCCCTHLFTHILLLLLSPSSSHRADYPRLAAPQAGLLVASESGPCAPQQVAPRQG